MVSIADVFTVLNALLGFSAVIVALEGELELAYLLIVMAVLADGVDGMVARRFGSKWNIGDFLDIMADTASFAFAPSVIMYLTYREGLGVPDLGLGTIEGRLIVLIAGGWVITAGVMRLARFCYETGTGEKYFTGMPIPSTALLIVVMLLMGWPGLVVVGFTVVSAFLMVSDFKWPKPRGSPGLAVGALGLLLVITTLAGDSFDWLSGFMMYLTFTATIMYQYLGPITERVRKDYIDPTDGDQDGPEQGEGPAG
jgi:CDP-diacylglycerol--serine O-phosphatidyltransferase